MQNSVFYSNKNLIAKIQNEQLIQEYKDVKFQQKDLKVSDLKLQVRSHRIILTSNSSYYAFLIQCQKIQSVDITSSGLIFKQYSIKIHTKQGKIKLYLNNYNEAYITIKGVVNKKAWLNTNTNNHKGSQVYMGMFKKVQQEKQKINTQGNTINQSFTSFENLFGNIKDIKAIMTSMKSKTGSNDTQNQQINNILKDIGFVSVVSKSEAGSKFINHLANDLYNICNSTLFKNFGGMVPLIDLFYFYNQKRKLELVSSQELLQACSLFQKLGYQAKLINYQNNIKMIQQTSFDAEKDFETQFSQYFKDYVKGYSAQQIANKKGIPLSIVEIKLRNAVKKGKLALDDRIEGIKFYKNYFLSI